jgi:hypothetical protein
LAAGAPGPFDIQFFMLSKSLPLLLGYFVVSFIADKHHVKSSFTIEYVIEPILKICNVMARYNCCICRHSSVFGFVNQFLLVGYVQIDMQGRTVSL